MLKKRKKIIVSLSVFVLGLGIWFAGVHADERSSVCSVEFIATPAPSTDEERAAAYTTASVVVSYRNGTKIEYPLSYKTLFYNTDWVGSNPYEAGRLYNRYGNPLVDKFGEPVIAETPDGNSLLQIPGMPISAGHGKKLPLYLVTHYEYDWILSDESEWNGEPMPMTMTLTTIEQNDANGDLTAVDQHAIDFSGVYGLWTPCAASQTPWNTHLGSEEDYNADARAIEEGTTTALNSMDQYYFSQSGAAKPYNYGIIPEVTVEADGSTTVAKHYSMGRATWEMAKVMPDRRTVYMGDDGTYTGLFMYIADRVNDLSSGTLYAAKWNQINSTNGGEATLTWIKLGHATDAEIMGLANTFKFSDIFETRDPPESGFVAVKTQSNGAKSAEYLKVKPGMEKAAAFLETRRYAAILGATTEFEKMEGVALNAKDNKIYIAMTRLSAGMEDKPSDTVNDIRLPQLMAGAVYELS